MKKQTRETGFKKREVIEIEVKYLFLEFLVTVCGRSPIISSKAVYSSKIQLSERGSKRGE